MQDFAASRWGMGEFHTYTLVAYTGTRGWYSITTHYHLYLALFALPSCLHIQILCANNPLSIQANHRHHGTSLLATGKADAWSHSKSAQSKTASCDCHWHSASEDAILVLAQTNVFKHFKCKNPNLNILFTEVGSFTVALVFAYVQGNKGCIIMTGQPSLYSVLLHLLSVFFPSSLMLYCLVTHLQSHTECVSALVLVSCVGERHDGRLI